MTIKYRKSNWPINFTHPHGGFYKHLASRHDNNENGEKNTNHDDNYSEDDNTRVTLT